MSKARNNGTLDRKPFNDMIDDDIARTTIVLPASLDQNLQVLSLKVGCTKNEVIKAAVRAYLLSQGLQPDQKPKINVSY